MNPAVMILANRSLAFHLYDFHLDGISVEELATAYSLPTNWITERIEAVRLCVKYQAQLSLNKTLLGFAGGLSGSEVDVR